jgi:hypothetical protein
MSCNATLCLPRQSASAPLGPHRRACRRRALVPRFDRPHNGGDESLIHRKSSVIAYGPTTSVGNDSGIDDLCH